MQVSVLQYNSPLTVPWRRRNEVAIVVTDASGNLTREDTSDAINTSNSSEAEVADDMITENEAPNIVRSWYDSGVRL